MYKKILVPLDGSPLSEVALPQAGMLAKAFGAEVILLAVVVFPDQGLGYIPIEYAASAEVLAATRRYLEREASSLRRIGVSVSTQAIGGYVAETIVGVAQSAQVDLIVMSTHGRSGVARWLIGSVADRVVQGARTPVLLIRPKMRSPRR